MWHNYKNFFILNVCI